MPSFKWTTPDSLNATLTLPEPLKFRQGGLGHVRSRFRSVALDQRTMVTELLAGGADVIEGRVRLIGDPMRFTKMLEDAADGALLAYEHANGFIFPALVPDAVGPLTEIVLDADRYGFGEWERTIRLRRVGGWVNLLGAPESFNDTGEWTHAGGLNVLGTSFTAHDLTATAAQLEDDAAQAFASLRQGFTDEQGRYLLSIFCRATNGSENGFPGLRAFVSESLSIRDPEVSFDPDTGDFELVGSSLGDVTIDHGVIQVDPSWLFVYLVVDHDATQAGTPFFDFFPARRDAVGGALFDDATGTQVAWGAQVVKLDDDWQPGDGLPAYIPESGRALWQIFRPGPNSG